MNTLRHLALLLLLSGCSYKNPYYDSSKPHHTPSGFRNNYLEGEVGGSFLKWQWERVREGLPHAPENGYRFPMVKPDLAWLQANRAQRPSQLSATFIGHATVLVQLGGLNILTDPMFSERAFAVQFLGPQRKVPPALGLSELPHIDVVLISHNHYDHLDRASVQALNRQAGGPPQFLVPLGLKSWFAEQGIAHAQEFDWWQSLEWQGLRFNLVPVQHWSARGVHDRFRTLWGGWWMQSVGAGAKSVFFAGDTGYSKDFADIRERFGPVDLALLPIGAYEPRWFMHNQHVNPAEAVQIHRDLQARQSIGIHWGSFELTDEALDEPPQALERALAQAHEPAERFIALDHGRTWRD
jgi:N-acyl-phosphatidylethanolamine-hydrolysing phospholipase D